MSFSTLTRWLRRRAGVAFPALSPHQELTEPSDPTASPQPFLRAPVRRQLSRRVFRKRWMLSAGSPWSRCTVSCSKHDKSNIPMALPGSPVVSQQENRQARGKVSALRHLMSRVSAGGFQRPNSTLFGRAHPCHLKTHLITACPASARVAGNRLSPLLIKPSSQGAFATPGLGLWGRFRFRERPQLP
ncbi:hypothetical protein B0T16DRAFT_236066 [Cercophora newfieldiana]|uniref:Uncharacterized protein n=1 Tax=Cercophora newfieldiana TaxID=92897 RepID=A0AA39XTC9_9PEZI|nr:hypothetical protein B0T16DRAFT_236066 [Cercophora newfieldiana]